MHTLNSERAAAASHDNENVQCPKCSESLASSLVLTSEIKKLRPGILRCNLQNERHDNRKKNPENTNGPNVDVS